jgi:hypothetical protein
MLTHSYEYAYAFYKIYVEHLVFKEDKCIHRTMKLICHTTNQAVYKQFEAMTKMIDAEEMFYSIKPVEDE